MRAERIGPILLAMAIGLSHHMAKGADREPVVELPPVDPARVHLIMLDSVARSHSYWYQAHLGGAIYDARRETIVGRLSPGLQIGRRFAKLGYFINFEIDQTFDLSQEVKKLEVLHLGVGVEVLQFLGHVRSSISIGPAFLRSHTDIDSRGKTGWYIDARPASLRWAWGKQGVVEFTPLSLDVSVPVTKGLPLVLFSYFTVLSLEWAKDHRENETSIP